MLFVSNWMRTNFGDLVDRGNWPDFDPATTALLEERPALDGTNPEPENLSAWREPQVRIKHYENTRVEIEVMPRLRA